MSKTPKTAGKSTAGKSKSHDHAAALRDGKKPGPKDSPVQVRNAGKESVADKPEDWDDQDEAVDETFPASDATAKY